MKGQVAKEALKVINQRVATDIIPKDELTEARIDHTTDMNKFHVSVVFNERCLKKLIKMNNETRRELSEHGTFFYGRIKGNTLCIVEYMSDFEKANTEFVEAAVNVTDRNMKEVSLLTEHSMLNSNPYNVVVHFHTHPAYVITKGFKVFKPNTTRYSEQDLYEYAYMQKYCQPKFGNAVLYTGGLLAVDEDKSQISMVFYDAVRKDFFNINNLYYMYHDELFKFNNFDITKSEKIEDTSGIKLMKELKDNN